MSKRRRPKRGRHLDPIPAEDVVAAAGDFCGTWDRIHTEDGFNRHVERMAELESAEAREALAQINETFRTEVKSDDAYVRRWRPTFGYAVAITWMATMGAVAWSIVAEPAQSPTIIAALVNTSPIWGIALAVLGVSVVKRSHDKAVQAGAQVNTGSPLGQALAAIAGKGGASG